MQPRHFIPILVYVLALNTPSFAQTNQEKIQAIRAEYNNINEQKHFTTKKLENDEYLDHMPDGGGELTGYYKGDTLYEITDRVGISSGVEKCEYYFDKGVLVFCYVVESHFIYDERLQQMDYSKQEVAFEGRYYIDNNTLIRTVKAGLPFGWGYDRPDADMLRDLLKKANHYSSLLKTNGRRS